MDNYKNFIKNTSNLLILHNLKTTGFPTDPEEQILLFKKFNIKDNGDYPISWEHIREFLPNFDDEFGVDRYLELHRKYNLQGDMEQAIKESKMPELDKEYLYFVYEIKH